MRWCLFLASVFFGLNASAQTVVRQMEGVTEYRLANGLQVLLAPNDLQPRTYVNLVVKTGSAVEGFGEGGMAHLLEHMVFKGTPTTRDPMKAFADRSLNFNGTTNHDRTNYFASMNPDLDNLHWYLSWLADASMHSLIAREDLDKEMTVVRNEFERAGSSADRAVWDARLALAFPNHGYGRPTIGNRTDIENVDIARLQAFYTTWYRPDNMVLVVSGRFDDRTTLAQIQSVFGRLKNPPAPLPTLYTREPVQDGVRESVIRRVGTEVVTLMGWRGAPRAHPDDAVLDVIAHSLANHGGGRFKTDIEKLALGTQISAWHAAGLQYGTLDISLRVKEAAQLEVVQALLLKHIADIAQSGVSAQELGQAQTAATTSYESTKRSAESFGASLADSAANGDWRLVFWYQDTMRRVTVADTLRVASAYCVDANRVRVSWVPEANPVRASDPVATSLGHYVAQPQWTQGSANFAPLERFEPTFAQIDQRIVRTTLKDGAMLALLPRPAAGDALSGTLRLHWGKLETMQGWGVAPALAGLLMKGTQHRTEANIKDELDRLQSTLTIQTSTDGLSISLTTTRQHWRAFASLMTDILRHPQFDEATFKVWRQAQIASIQRAMDSPDAKAQNALARAMSAPYAPSDPRYVPTQAESLARWQSLQLADIQRFWTAFAGASTAEFAAAGALDVEQVKQDMSRLLDDWPSPGGAASYQRIPIPYFAHASQTVHIPTPDKPNATMLVAYSLPVAAWSRESTAMELANGIVGGSASSRLYTKVRKEAGLSYGVGSFIRFSENDQTATFGWYGIFAPSNKSQFEATVKEVFDDIRVRGLSSVELFFAKRVAADRIRQGLASDRYLASEMASALYQSRRGEIRNAAWYESKQAALQSLTIEELDAAAKQLADLPRAVTVSAGDFP
jgi:zinc protease